MAMHISVINMQSSIAPKYYIPLCHWLTITITFFNITAYIRYVSVYILPSLISCLDITLPLAQKDKCLPFFPYGRDKCNESVKLLHALDVNMLID